MSVATGNGRSAFAVIAAMLKMSASNRYATRNGQCLGAFGCGARTSLMQFIIPFAIFSVIRIRYTGRYVIAKEG